MERDKYNFLHFSDNEQAILGIGQSCIAAAWAPRLLNELVKRTMARSQQDLQLARCSPGDIEIIDHLAKSGGIDDQLTVLNDMKEELGELASREIITDALEGISGINRLTLHQK